MIWCYKILLWHMIITELIQSESKLYILKRTQANLWSHQECSPFAQVSLQHPMWLRSQSQSVVANQFVMPHHLRPHSRRYLRPWKYPILKELLFCKSKVCPPKSTSFTDPLRSTNTWHVWYPWYTGGWTQKLKEKSQDLIAYSSTPIEHFLGW